MIKKQLTCKTYLTAYGENTVVARLDTGDPNKINTIVTEPAERLDHRPMIRLSEDRHYLVGEIADSLYAYEQLGYTPMELSYMINELQMYKSIEKVRNGILVTARCNGKTFALQRAMYEYLLNDYRTTEQLVEWRKQNPYLPYTNLKNLEIEKVIFNDPATIVIWKDGTKTVVKATNEVFDPEKGLAMAISKKALGNKGNYFETIKKWTGEHKDHPIKSKRTCMKCMWGLNNPGCAGHEYCEDCPRKCTDGNLGCECGNIHDGEPCKYFEEVPHNG